MFVFIMMSYLGSLTSLPAISRRWGYQ